MDSGGGTRVWAALAATVVVAAGLVTGAAAASAAPGDDVSLAFEPADFGPTKTGTTVRKAFLMTNDGLEPVTVDPAPVLSIAGSFAPVSTTIVAGETIAPGTTRTVTVEYTAGAVGTTAAQGVVFTAVSTIDTTRTGNFAMILSGEAIATDPVSFEITQPTGGIVDFGHVAVGSSVSRSITITNNGVRDLKFESDRISIVDGTGAPLPVTIDGDPFVRELVPGATATIGFTFTPGAVGAVSGVVRIIGIQYFGDVVRATATRELGLAAAGLAAPIDPTAPNPTTPVAVSQAGATGGRQLASTGADAAALFVGGTAGMMIVLAGVALLVERRIRRSA